MYYSLYKKVHRQLNNGNEILIRNINRAWLKCNWRRNLTELFRNDFSRVKKLRQVKVVTSIYGSVTKSNFCNLQPSYCLLLSPPEFPKYFRHSAGSFAQQSTPKSIPKNETTLNEKHKTCWLSIFEPCYLQIGISGWLTGHYNFRCQPVDYSNHPSTLRVIFSTKWWYQISCCVICVDVCFCCY